MGVDHSIFPLSPSRGAAPVGAATFSRILKGGSRATRRLVYILWIPLACKSLGGRVLIKTLPPAFERVVKVFLFFLYREGVEAMLGVLRRRGRAWKIPGSPTDGGLQREVDASYRLSSGYLPPSCFGTGGGRECSPGLGIGFAGKTPSLYLGLRLRSPRPSFSQGRLRIAAAVAPAFLGEVASRGAATTARTSRTIDLHRRRRVRMQVGGGVGGPSRSHCRS